MPTFMFEAIDAATGKEIRDTVDATNADEAQATIRSMGYMVTKIKAQKKSASAAGGKKPGRTFAFGKVKQKELTLFTRQLSILQDAGLPILRSLKVLAEMQQARRVSRMRYSTRVMRSRAVRRYLSQCRKVRSVLTGCTAT